jgi:hypothetical protein
MYLVPFFKVGMKSVLLQLILVLSFTIAFSKNNDTTFISRHPVYAPGTSNVEALKQSVAPLMRMSIKEVIAEVPE